MHECWSPYVSQNSLHAKSQSKSASVKWEFIGSLSLHPPDAASGMARSRAPDNDLKALPLHVLVLLVFDFILDVRSLLMGREWPLAIPQLLPTS